MLFGRGVGIVGGVLGKRSAVRRTTRGVLLTVLSYAGGPDVPCHRTWWSEPANDAGSCVMLAQELR